MKHIVLSLISLFAVFAFAQEQVETPPTVPPPAIMIQGSGSSFGMCDGGPNSYFCTNDLKQRAEQNANWNIQNNCFNQGGQVVGLPYCNTLCNPAYIPPGTGSQMINCQSNCQGSCQLRAFETE